MDIQNDEHAFINEIKTVIATTKKKVARTVNTELTLLYWQVGKRLSALVLHDADWNGKGVMKRFSDQLTQSFGKGWSVQQLHHCTRFYRVFSDPESLYTLCRDLSWSHFRLLMYIDDDLKRDFYLELSRLENWSVRQLRGRIKSLLFERTAISKKPDLTIRKDIEKLRTEDAITPDLVFKDPYILDFLGLADTYSENDLESAILNELQKFLIELGADFAFLARQKRIVIDKKDYYIDLLFYHRRLKCLVVIDLKIGEFEAGYKGQMELYLRYLEKHEHIEGEHSPIGLILCTGKNEEHIELLQLDKSNIRVAEYLTQLPSRAVFKEQLHKAIEKAKRRLQ